MREYGRKTELLSRISPGFSRLGAAVFLAGFLLGMALIFIGQEGLVQNTSFLTSDSLEWIGTLEINRKGLMLYCLRQRLLPAVLLVLAAAAGEEPQSVFSSCGAASVRELCFQCSLSDTEFGESCCLQAESFRRRFCSYPLSGCCAAGVSRPDGTGTEEGLQWEKFSICPGTVECCF